MGNLFNLDSRYINGSKFMWRSLDTALILFRSISCCCGYFFEAGRLQWDHDMCLIPHAAATGTANGKCDGWAGTGEGAWRTRFQTAGQTLMIASWQMGENGKWQLVDWWTAGKQSETAVEPTMFSSELCCKLSLNWLKLAAQSVQLQLTAKCLDGAESATADVMARGGQAREAHSGIRGFIFYFFFFATILVTGLAAEKIKELLAYLMKNVSSSTCRRERESSSGGCSNF